MTTTNAPAAGQALKAKREKLAEVRAERDKLEENRLELKRRATRAAELVQQAKLAEVLARGTPGFEDDAAAARSLRAARKEQEDAANALESAEERLETLHHASEHLGREVSALTEDERRKHLESAKAALQQRIAKASPGFAEMVRVIAALRLLENRSTWPEELIRVLKETTPVGELQPLVREGQSWADRIKAGATVEEVCP